MPDSIAAAAVKTFQGRTRFKRICQCAIAPGALGKAIERIGIERRVIGDGPYFTGMGDHHDRNGRAGIVPTDRPCNCLLCYVLDVGIEG
jgi:hypothetical protein